MTKAAHEKKPATPDNKAKVDEQTGSKPQAKPGRVISDPNEVAQLVMMRIDHVNSKKDELTIAVKSLADTAKQLVSVYAKQQAQIAKLAKRVEELEKRRKVTRLNQRTGRRGEGMENAGKKNNRVCPLCSV